MIEALESYIRKARFLIVDDELANVRLLEGNLEEDGHENLRSLTDPLQVLQLFREYEPDIVLLDLSMPQLDGYGVMKQLRDITPPDENLPVIVLTADISEATRNRALAAGARDFLTKPFNPIELRLRVRNLLESRFLYRGIREQNRLLDERVAERTAELEDALKKLRESQRQALHQERLHAFSEMAGGVVHDFNNVLMILMGLAEMLTRDSEVERKKSIETIQLVLKDAAQLVTRLHYFYRPRHQDDVFVQADLKKLIEEAAQLSKPKWKSEARAAGRDFTLNLDLEKMPRMVCNASELREALLNLIFNAVDAMPNGGVISLALHHSARGAEICVGDTGMGMSPEVRARCLDPFYSTKGEKGTGLGLAMVYGIVQRHGGTLEIDSTPGEGTTFRIILPETGEATPEVELLRAPQSSKRLRILLAEDDDRLRQLIVQQLESVGHTVTAAVDGLEARQLLELTPFDLILTDLSMPRLNGISLAASAREMGVQVPVIMLTGFGTMLLPDGNRPAGVDILLSKPISRDNLAAAIAKVAA